MRLNRFGWLLALLIVAASLAFVGMQAYGIGPRIFAPNLIDVAAIGILGVLALVGALQTWLWLRQPSAASAAQADSMTNTLPGTTSPTRDPMVNIRMLVRYMEPLRAWLPLMAVVFAALYAIGFLVVNSYLGQYGVRELEPVRARYAAAAPVFALLVFAVISVLGTFGEGRLKFAWNPRDGRERRIGLWIVWATFALFALVLGEDEFLQRFGFGSLDIWSRYRNLALVDASIALPYMIARSTKQWDWQQVFTVVGSALVALTSYATNVYTRVPAWAGGGHPDAVQIAFVGDAPAECSACRTRVDLIDADDFRVIVLVDHDGRQDAVELARSTVRLIVHLPTQ